MSVSFPLLSNCGDYVPGTEPRQPTPTSNAVSPTWVPNPNTENPVFNTPACPPPPSTGTPSPPAPGIPVPGVPPTTPPPGPTTGGPAGPTATPPGPTTGGPAGPTAGTPAGPTTGGPAGPSAPAPGGTGGPITGGPAGPSAPAPAGTGPAGPTTGGTGGTGGPITGGPAGPSAPIPTGPASGEYYCHVENLPCPASSPNPNGVLRVIRSCLPWSEELGPAQVFASFEDCITQGCDSGPYTEENCISSNNNGGTTGGTTGGGSTTPSTPSTNEPNETSVSQTQQQVLIGNTYQSTVSTQTNSVTNSNFTVGQSVNSGQLNSTLQQSVPQREVVTINVTNPIFAGFISPSSAQTCVGLYNRLYNPLNFPASPSTVLVGNSQYTQLFNTTVCEEVAYFLERQNNQYQYWYEKNFNNLTLEKISASLSPQAFTYFNNIHGAGNIQISPTVFYSMVKKHLLEGTLDEFDINYYRRIYEKQINDPFINYSETGQTPNTINVALALFQQNSVTPNYNNSELSIELRNDYLRMRFLPEDLGAYLEITESEGNVSNLYLTNNGIPVEQVTAVAFIPTLSPSTIPFGNGAGYYFSTLNYPTSSILPLPAITNLSSSYYLPPRDRFNLLTLLNVDTSYKFIVRSLQGIHEFSSTYNASADLGPMYLVLDVSSVETIPIANSVVAATSATYYRISDSEAIEHSRNNGFNVIKLNADYRDPFVNYVKDSSSLYFESNDFNLESVGLNTTPTGRNILRNIPQAIIVTPGCGTEHNPFNGVSELDYYESGKVQRSLKLNPSIDNSTFDPSKPPLEQNRIYFELSSNSLGSYEESFYPDFHGYVYSYNSTGQAFNRSYFSAGEYTNVQPPSSSRMNSPEGKFMSLVDSLTFATSALREELLLSGISDFGFLTWMDIFNRIPSNEIGRLKYSKFEQFRDKLKDGYSNNIPVVFVLTYNNTSEGYPNPNNYVTGLPESAYSLINPPAPLIVTEYDRAVEFVRTFPGEVPP